MPPFLEHVLWSVVLAAAAPVAAGAASGASTDSTPPHMAAAEPACRPLPRTGTNDDVALGALRDGTVWYGDRRGHRLVRISADGRRVPLVPGDGTTSALSGLALGPDGSVWYTKDSSSRIGRIGPRGDSREFATPEPGSFPAGLVADRAGRLWFHSRVKNYIARVQESGAVAVYRGPVALSTGFAPQGMTLGADGNLWLTDRGHNAIYRFDVESHRFTRFDIATPRADPGAITAGTDGNVWFTMNAVGRVGRITPQGEITEIVLGDLAGAALRGIASTPDGSMWVTTRGRLAVRILADGAVRTFPCANGLGTAIAGPGGVPWFFDDQRVWVVETSASVAAPAHAAASAPAPTPAPASASASASAPAPAPAPAPARAPVPGSR